MPPPTMIRKRSLLEATADLPEHRRPMEELRQRRGLNTNELIQLGLVNPLTGEGNEPTVEPERFSFSSILPEPERSALHNPPVPPVVESRAQTPSLPFEMMAPEPEVGEPPGFWKKLGLFMRDRVLPYATEFGVGAAAAAPARGVLEGFGLGALSRMQDVAGAQEAARRAQLEQQKADLEQRRGETEIEKSQVETEKARKELGQMDTGYEQEQRAKEAEIAQKIAATEGERLRNQRQRILNTYTGQAEQAKISESLARQEYQQLRAATERELIKRGYPALQAEKLAAEAARAQLEAQRVEKEIELLPQEMTARRASAEGSRMGGEAALLRAQQGESPPNLWGPYTRTLQARDRRIAELEEALRFTNPERQPERYRQIQDQIKAVTAEYDALLKRMDEEMQQSPAAPFGRQGGGFSRVPSSGIGGVADPATRPGDQYLRKYVIQ